MLLRIAHQPAGVGSALLVIVGLGLLSSVSRIATLFSSEEGWGLRIPTTERAGTAASTTRSSEQRSYSSEQISTPNQTEQQQQPSVLDRCWRDRFHGYWNDTTNSMQFFDATCNSEMKILVQEVEGNYTNPTLFDQIEGSCILMFGDSTDRMITEDWCPKWRDNNSDTEQEVPEMWIPTNYPKRPIPNAIFSNSGLRCSPANKFTFGNYMQYGVAPPPYWKGAHLYRVGYDVPRNLDWGATTAERVNNDIPKYFEKCASVGHDKLNVVIVQSYLWDLARQWHVHRTKRPPVRFVQEWAANVTALVESVRAVVPADTLIAWRYAGPLVPDEGKEFADSQVIHDMNAAVMALQMNERVDFVADYGAVLASTLASINNGGPFNLHPPAIPRTAYLNMLLNSIVAAIQSVSNPPAKLISEATLGS